jgi:copper chaperone CopZ
MKHLIPFLIASVLVSVSAISQKTDPGNQPVELGDISWYRNIDEAKQEAANVNKPILILFQEVPGCSTCKNYGNNVLSHPLLVDIIENEFVPLAIYNNKGGEDGKVLKHYGEPTWNNPVLRAVRPDGKDIVSRHAGRYDVSSLASYMEFALSTYGANTPEYVDVIAEELTSEKRNVSEAYYSMYCFWTGEAKLGQLDGVISTSPGFMNGHEVVKVVYDKQKTNTNEISKKVKSDKFSFVTDPSKFRMDRDPQYYLKKSVYKYLPLSESQRTKINSAIAQRTNPDVYLSPTQYKWKKKIMEKKSDSGLVSLYDKDLMEAWKMCQEKFPV